MIYYHSLQLVQISQQKMFHIMLKTIDYNYGILLVNNVSDHLYRVIQKMQIVLQQFTMQQINNHYRVCRIDNKIGQDGFVILVGNKIDLEDRVVSEQQGKKKAEQIGIEYFQISAKTGHNIQKLFCKLLDIAQGGQTYKTSTENTKPKQKQNPIKQQKQQEIQGNHVDATTSAIIQDKANQKNKNIVLNNVQLNKQQKKKTGCC